MKSFAIVLVCYSRLNGLKRLLSSLEKVDYDHRDDIYLIFSIDNSGSDEVLNFAKMYQWNFGEKRIRTFEKRQGLKQHILQCGEFTKDYDVVVVLEDDIYVSDSMYYYAYQASQFYEYDDRVAGISLYSFQKNWLKWLARFEPQRSKYDVFFMKIAQSWGQVWTQKKWDEFMLWLNKNSNFTIDDTLPQALNQWPESSWLKFHDKYCIKTGKYFVYPYTSVSTNCSDAGEHNSKSVTDHQVELMYGKNKYSFLKFSSEAILYDEFMEREGMGKYLGVSDADLTVTLWGTKPKCIYKRYVLTLDDLPYKCINRFGLSLRPIELNVIKNYKGQEIKLYDTKYTSDSKTKYKCNDYVRYKYSIRSSDYKTLFTFSTKMLSNIYIDIKRKIHQLKMKIIAE